ncbi:MAG: UvrD-helicase domain-containing protein [Nitrospirae bacterium]|nr:UvrD-helicase domain-containing protein [Nitrospirota bacterium]
MSATPRPISLAGLNPEQRQAVVHSDGALMIFAGAGTGKTRVITNRIGHLVTHRRVPAGRILAVTFTNKAAREMRERVDGLIPKREAVKGLTVSTFHSLCVRVLRDDGHHLGLPQNFSIFGESDQKGLIRGILTDLAVDMPPAQVLAAISLAKNRLITPEGYPEENADDSFIKSVYQRYQTLLAGMGAVDFDDLMLHAIRLFSTFGHVKVGWQRRFPHILVDEFQDTNQAQYTLLRQLWDGSGSLAVVGDDDQAIYAWRGAEADMFARFAEDFPKARKVVLTQNYRSTSRILAAAGGVIEKIPGRAEKRLWSQLGDGPKIGLIVGTDADDEATRVVEDLNVACFAGRHELTDFAILIRTNAQSRPFEAALRQAHIPYVVVGATGFFDRAEIRDLTGYLRFLNNDADEAALRRIINVPRRGIGAQGMAAAARYAADHSVPLFDAMDRAVAAPDTVPGVSGGARAGFAQFIDLTAQLRFDFERGDMVAALHRLIEQAGLKEYWQDTADTPRQGELRLEGALELARMLARYVQRAQEPTLTDFLSHLSLLDRLEDDKDSKGRVTIITLHAAKGLEFPNVYLAGMEEGFLPHTRSVEENRDVAEERRLTYVGITRAQRRLVLSHAQSRSRYGERLKRTPSRFLDDIPRHLIATPDDEPEGTNQELAANFFSSVKNLFD